MMNLCDKQNGRSKPLIERRIAALPDEHVHALICSARFHLDRVGVEGVSARNLVAFVLKCVSQDRGKELGVDPPSLADLECSAAFKFYLKSLLRVVINKLMGDVQSGEVGFLIVSELPQSLIGFKTGFASGNRVHSEHKQTPSVRNRLHASKHNPFDRNASELNPN